MNDFKPNEYLFVHIIESPSPANLLSNVSEGGSISDALRLMGIKSQYYLAVNSDAFQMALLRIFEAHAKTSFSSIPIIHISAHGNTKGIRLTSGKLLSWDALEKDLISLNKALRGYLLLCMSSCKGIYAASMICNEKTELPFFAIVGNSGEPYWSETVVGFTTIYHLLGKGKNIQEAVEAARIASGNRDFQIFCASTIKKMWTLKELLKVLGK